MTDVILSKREYQRKCEANYRARLKTDPERLARRYAKERARRAANPEKWRDYYKGDYRRRRERNPASVALRSARRRARKYGMEFNLTYEWAHHNYALGSALSGIPFKGEKGPFSCSIDRIDAAGGYTIENSRMLLNAENLFKNEWSDEVVISIAKAIAARNE